MRQVGESQGGDGRPELPFGTEEMRRRWNLNKEGLKKKKIQAARFFQASGGRGQRGQYRG